jgi:hypothetical protein
MLVCWQAGRRDQWQQRQQRCQVMLRSDETIIRPCVALLLISKAYCWHIASESKRKLC